MEKENYTKQPSWKTRANPWINILAGLNCPKCISDALVNKFKFPGRQLASTSMQRHDVASTLRRRYIYVMCPLGYYINKYKKIAKHDCFIERLRNITCNEVRNCRSKKKKKKELKAFGIYSLQVVHVIRPPLICTRESNPYVMFDQRVYS